MRNDGNKIYHVEKLSDQFDGHPLPLDMLASSVFEEASDVFAEIRIEVDQSKHVKPIATAT